MALGAGTLMLIAGKVTHGSTRRTVVERVDATQRAPINGRACAGEVEDWIEMGIPTKKGLSAPSEKSSPRPQFRRPQDL